MKALSKISSPQPQQNTPAQVPNLQEKIHPAIRPIQPFTPVQPAQPKLPPQPTSPSQPLFPSSNSSNTNAPVHVVNPTLQPVVQPVSAVVAQPKQAAVPPLPLHTLPPPVQPPQPLLTLPPAPPTQPQPDYLAQLNKYISEDTIERNRLLEEIQSIQGEIQSILSSSQYSGNGSGGTAQFGKKVKEIQRDVGYLLPESDDSSLMELCMVKGEWPREVNELSYLHAYSDEEIRGWKMGNLLEAMKLYQDERWSCGFRTVRVTTKEKKIKCGLEIKFKLSKSIASDFSAEIFTYSIIGKKIRSITSKTFNLLNGPESMVCAIEWSEPLPNIALKVEIQHNQAVPGSSQPLICKIPISPLKFIIPKPGLTEKTFNEAYSKFARSGHAVIKHSPIYTLDTFIAKTPNDLSYYFKEGVWLKENFETSTQSLGLIYLGGDGSVTCAFKIRIRPEGMFSITLLHREGTESTSNATGVCLAKLLMPFIRENV